MPASLQSISAAWRRCWLLNRIQNDDILDRVGKLDSESVRAELWTDEDGQFRLPFEAALHPRTCRVAPPPVSRQSQLALPGADHREPVLFALPFIDIRAGSVGA